MILPITTNTKLEDAFPLRIKIPKGTCGLEKASEALVDQMLAWDISLFKKDLGEIPEGLQELTKLALRDYLDLN
jgi:mRNA-degrading endonuclease toxin of MazEF toxin-antitoxin module